MTEQCTFSGRDWGAPWWRTGRAAGDLKGIFLSSVRIQLILEGQDF